MVNKNYIPKQHIPLFADYELSVEKLNKKTYRYCLNKEHKEIYSHNYDKSPIEVNQTSMMVKSLIKELSGNVTIKQDGIEAEVSNDAIQKSIMNNLRYLEQALESYALNRETIEKEQNEKAQKEKRDLVCKQADEFMDYLDKHELEIVDFLMYAGEWLAGGESKNIMIGFICHISTYFQIKPVWFMPLGKAGEGKTVIDTNPALMLPKNAFMNGRVSESALHRKAKKCGDDYLDGKILTMKDLGGEHDIEKWNDTLNRYKELTTDGEAEFEITGDSVDEDTGERDVLTFKLVGYPSVTLTSVNSESFDEQIMSRGVNVSPEATNAQVRAFFRYNKGLIAKKRDKVIDEEISMLHGYLEYIKEMYADIEVINPYWTCLEDWFKTSEYYKRSLSLYPSLVEALTLLHYDYRQVIETDNGTYVIATKQDNKIVADLFNPSQGISESAVRVFNLMLKWFKPYNPKELELYNDGDLKIRDCDTIFSVGEIKNRTGKIRSLRGLPIGSIVSTLTAHGFIEPVDKIKRSNNNIYALNREEPLTRTEMIFDEDKITEYVWECEWVYGILPPHLLEIIKNEKSEKGLEASFGDLALPPWVSTSPQLSPNQAPQSPESSKMKPAPSPQKQSQARNKPAKKDEFKMVEE